MRIFTMKVCTYAFISVLFFLSVMALLSLYHNASATLYPPKDNSKHLPPNRHRLNDHLGENLSGLFWFVQVTDIHVSIFRDHERISEFGKFCSWLQTTIKPPVILASGDLTDAKTSDHLGSQQWLQEWQFYKETISNCMGSASKSRWLDVRGNHDTFDVPDDTSENNFFKRFSIQGPSHQRSYAKTFEFLNRTYGFVAIDATLVPGPKRPFNFFGAFDNDEFDKVRHLVEKTKSESDHHIVFGHYPTSCILAPAPGIRALLSHAKAYLCGHLHTLAGIVPEMFAHQHEGFFELELGDWKDNRRFRVLAIDQGQLSFSDNKFSSKEDQAVIVVSNPVDIRFSAHPNSVEMIRNSTHIRILVFSYINIDKVNARIDDKERFACHRVSLDQPLFVVTWNPLMYDDGLLHNLEVEVVLSGGQRQSKTISFGLGSKDNFNEIANDFSFMARLVLMTNLLTLTQAVFAILMLTIVIPLCLLRLQHTWTVAGHLTRPRRPSADAWIAKFWLHNLHQRFWLISAIDSLFYPLVLAPLYLLVGPWAIGYFLNDSFGVLFAWGFWIRGTLLHADTTSFYAVFFMAPYLFIFTYGIAGIVQRRYDNYNNSDYQPPSFASYCLSHTWLFILMAFQLLHFIDNYLCYGFIASLGVCGLARILYFGFLWNQAMSISSEEWQKLKIVWPKMK